MGQFVYTGQNSNGVLFNTSTLLTASQNFDTGVLPLNNCTQVQTHVLADQDGSIIIEFYNGMTDLVRTLTIPYSASDGYQLFSAPAFSSHVRYQFANGGVDQGDFLFETKCLSTGLSPQILSVDAFINSNMVSQLNRSVLVGRDDVTNNYNNVLVNNRGALLTSDYFREIKLGNVSQLEGLDKFGRTPISGAADAPLAI